jgi:hypothetical protein
VLIITASLWLFTSFDLLLFPKDVSKPTSVLETSFSFAVILSLASTGPSIGKREEKGKKQVCPGNLESFR